MKLKMKKGDAKQMALIFENEQEILDIFCLFNYRPITEASDFYSDIFHTLSKYRDDHREELSRLAGYHQEFENITNTIKERIKK